VAYVGLVRQHDRTLAIGEIILDLEREVPTPLSRSVNIVFRAWEWDDFGQYGTLSRSLHWLFWHMKMAVQSIPCLLRTVIEDYWPVLLIGTPIVAVAVMICRAKQRYEQDIEEAEAFVQSFGPACHDNKKVFRVDEVLLIDEATPLPVLPEDAV